MTEYADITRFYSFRAALQSVAHEEVCKRLINMPKCVCVEPSCVLYVWGGGGDGGACFMPSQ